MGRTLAIGDIHGSDYALDALLDLIAPTPDDTVVVLGDIVDRGPGSRQVIDRLLALRGTCWDHARLRAALTDFRSLKAEEFLERYGG